MSAADLPPSQPLPGAGPADQQRWLEAILDLLPFPALLVEPGTDCILFTNRTARSALPISGNGLPHTECMTDHAGARVPPEQNPWQRAARGEGFAGQQVCWDTPQGRAFFLAFSGTAPAMHGHTPLAVVTFLDVTPLKQSETDLRKAIEARDELFSVATHELKDPLFALQMSIQLLRRTVQKQGAVPGPLLHHLEVSQRQADRLDRLVDNLLDVSRISNHRIQLDLDAFDLCDAAREVADRFQEQARAAGSQLTVETYEAIIGYWDRIKMEQVTANLLSNALKYGAGKPVKLRVCATASTAFLQVQDQGNGIADADQQRIFERFERVSAEHRRKSLGLGLYIVRALVEAHGGSIELESMVGRGSTFTVQVPRKRLHPESDGRGSDA